MKTTMAFNQLDIEKSVDQKNYTYVLMEKEKFKFLEIWGFIELETMGTLGTLAKVGSLDTLGTLETFFFFGILEFVGTLETFEILEL